MIKNIENAKYMIQRRIDRTWLDLKYCKEDYEVSANHAERDALEYALRLLNDITV